MSYSQEVSRIAKRSRGRARSRKPVTLDEFFSRDYLPGARARKRSWEVDERIGRRHISPAFGHLPLKDISRRDVEAWLNGLLERLAPSTCNRILAVLKAAFTLAEGLGLVSASPCAGVRSFRPGVVRDRHLSLEDTRRLLAFLEESGRPEALALRILTLTGGRKMEILHARWEDVRLDERVIVVPLSKSGKPRHIVLSDEACRAIASIPRVKGSPWLFPGRAKGKPLSDIYNYWNSVRKALGLNGVRIHDLRHTFASILVNGGHSLFETQLILGHADPRTTMRYAHLDQPTLLMAVNDAGKALRGGEAPGARQAAEEPATDGCRKECVDYEKKMIRPAKPAPEADAMGLAMAVLRLTNRECMCRLICGKSIHYGDKLQPENPHVWLTAWLPK